MSNKVENTTTYRQETSTENAGDWKKSCSEEMKSVLKPNIFRLVVAPTHRNPIDSKKGLKIKKNECGGVSRFKERYFVNGFIEIFGVDYDLNQVPVSRISSINHVQVSRMSTFNHEQVSRI